MSAQNVYHLLVDTAARHGSRTALFQPIPTSRREAAHSEPKYKTCTWNEFRDTVRHIALGLYGLGVRKGDIAAIHAETRLEFYLADYGILALGALSAGLYTAIPMAEQAGNLVEAAARQGHMLRKFHRAMDDPRLAERGEAHGLGAVELGVLERGPPDQPVEQGRRQAGLLDIKLVATDHPDRRRQRFRDRRPSAPRGRRAARLRRCSRAGNARRKE